MTSKFIYSPFFPNSHKKTNNFHIFLVYHRFYFAVCMIFFIKVLQTTNALIARPLSVNPNCALYRCACLWPRHSPTYTIIVAHLTQQQQVQLLTPLAMTRFGPSIESINFPTTPSRYATCYATDAGKLMNKFISATTAHQSRLDIFTSRRKYINRQIEAKIFNLRNADYIKQQR